MRDVDNDDDYDVDSSCGDGGNEILSNHLDIDIRWV